jgi:hypothetical protein
VLSASMASSSLARNRQMEGGCSSSSTGRTGSCRCKFPS